MRAHNHDFKEVLSLSLSNISQITSPPTPTNSTPNNLIPIPKSVAPKPATPFVSVTTSFPCQPQAAPPSPPKKCSRTEPNLSQL